MTRFNGYPAALAKLLLAFALGAGTAVAAAYNTFETATAHQHDQERTDRMLEEIRADIKILLGRSQFRTPRTLPPEEGWGNPPRPPKGAK